MHILEARKLVGAAINPVVKIACGMEVKRTSSRKGTNSPFFDEVSSCSSTNLTSTVTCTQEQCFILCMFVRTENETR